MKDSFSCLEIFLELINKDSHCIETKGVSAIPPFKLLNYCDIFI